MSEPFTDDELDELRAKFAADAQYQATHYGNCWRDHYACLRARALATIDVQRAEALARAEAAKREHLASTQGFVDRACHYRNLAIFLGAKPEQMEGKYDRELCENGVTAIPDALNDLGETWKELEAAEHARDEAIALLREAREKIGWARRGTTTAVSLESIDAFLAKHGRSP